MPGAQFTATWNIKSQTGVPPSVKSQIVRRQVDERDCALYWENPGRYKVWSTKPTVTHRTGDDRNYYIAARSRPGLGLQRKRPQTGGTGAPHGIKPQYRLDHSVLDWTRLAARLCDEMGLSRVLI